MTPQELVKQLPSKFQSGSVFIGDGDITVYLVWLLFSTIFFFIVYEIVKFALQKFLQKEMDARDGDQKIWYINGFVTIVHHLIILPMIYYVMYYSCQNENGWPWPSKKGGTYSKLGGDKSWGFLKDESCFIEPNKGYAMTQLFSIGYMIHDFIKITVIRSGGMDKYTKECILHHTACVTAFVCSFYCGYAYPGICVLFLIAEASTIFLTYNDMFSPENSHSTLALINKIMFFIVFTLTRIVMWPYFQYLIFLNF